MSQPVKSCGPPRRSESPKTATNDLIKKEKPPSQNDTCANLPLSLTIRNILSQPVVIPTKGDTTESPLKRATIVKDQQFESCDDHTNNIESKFTKCYPHSDVVVHAYRQGRHYISCKSCTAYPDLVKRYSYKRRLPPIATPKGTIFRRETLHNHIKTSGHIETSKIYKSAVTYRAEVSRFQMVPAALPPPTAPTPVMNGSEELTNHLGGIMLLLYDAAKQLRPLDINWPSHVGIIQRAMKYKMRILNLEEPTESTVETSFQNQLMSINHQELLECIVEAHRAQVIKKLDRAVAVCLHCDGYVDPMQTDKLFVTCKIILPNGNLERIFIGVGEPEERGTSSVFQAIKDNISCNLSTDSTTLLSLLTSVTYNGTNVNASECGDLWEMMDHELNTCKDKHLIKVWCALHRPELAWQSVSSAVPEITTIYQRLINLSSYFHTSGVHLRELRKTAKQLKLELFQLPEVSEVRWTNFSYNLLNAVLISWQPLVSYLKQASKQDKVAQKHFNFLTNLGQLEFLTFLADLTFVFQRFQKGIQRNSVSILDLEDAVRMVCATIHTLKTQQLPGGWKNAMQEMLNENGDGEVYLKGITLSRQLLDDHRDASIVEQEVADILFQFLQQGFQIDDEVLKMFQPFVQLNALETDIHAIHKALIPDLELAELAVQFQELSQQESLKKFSLSQLVRHLAASQHYTEVCTALSRILVVKPHLADIEWITNANQSLRSSSTKSLNRITENLYLFIHHNLPPVEEWEPKAALITWFQKQKEQRNVLDCSKNKQYPGALETWGGPSNLKDYAEPHQKKKVGHIK